MTGATVTMHRHGDAASFVAVVSDRLTALLRQGLQMRGKASLAVPGGTTPGPVFDRLADTELDWSHVTVTLTDERWVPATDPASNEHLVRQRLLQRKAQAARLIGLHSAAATPNAGIAEVSARLDALPLPFDAVLLGMGGDGHFASLFPGMAALAEGLALDKATRCVANDAPINGQSRISLTLPLLLQAKMLLLAVRGADKLAVIERAKTTSPTDLPIAAVLRQERVPVEIHYTD
ncbi:MAG TPA: 6-phosphogluconolactonase [Terriglobales bacterium]|nr:6-phosphogluconolactonase [Terriglobales bacterium]